MVLLRWIVDELLIRSHINVHDVQTVEMSLPADTGDIQTTDVVFEPEAHP